MVQRFCDRCGKHYQENPDYIQAPPFEYRIQYINSTPFYTRHIDLCRDCQKKLNQFLCGEPEKDKDASIDTSLGQIAETAECDTTFLDTNPCELKEDGTLSVRSANCLGRAGLTLRDVLYMDLETIRSIRNLGKHSVDEIVRVLHAHGYKMEWEGNE